MMNSNVLRFGGAAVAVIAAGVVGLSFLSGNVGGPTPTPAPFPSPVTLASGNFTASLLASGVTTVDIDAIGNEPRLRVDVSRSATPASGSMEVSDADGRFSVDVQCTRWGDELLIGGEVTDSIAFDGVIPVACVLGGDDRRTLLMCVAADWKREVVTRAPTGRIDACAVDVPGAGRP